MIFKAEVVRQPGKAARDNPCFLITNLNQNPQWVNEQVYCQRGDLENRLKELHQSLEICRTCCTKFWANQFRVLMTAAYVLMQKLRLRAARTDCARAQVGTLRERLLKLGAYVVISVRRVVIHLPISFPFLEQLPPLRSINKGAKQGITTDSRPAESSRFGQNGQMLEQGLIDRAWGKVLGMKQAGLVHNGLRAGFVKPSYRFKIVTIRKARGYGSCDEILRRKKNFRTGSSDQEWAMQAGSRSRNHAW